MQNFTNFVKEWPVSSDPIQLVSGSALLGTYEETLVFEDFSLPDIDCFLQLLSANMLY